MAITQRPGYAAPKAGLQEIISNMIGLLCKAQQFQLTSGSQKCPKEIICVAECAQCHLSIAATVLGEVVDLTGARLMKDAWFPELKPTTHGASAEKELSDALDICIQKMDAIEKSSTYCTAVTNDIAKHCYCLRVAKYDFDNGTSFGKDKDKK